MFCALEMKEVKGEIQNFRFVKSLIEISSEVFVLKILPIILQSGDKTQQYGGSLVCHISLD